MGRTTATGTLTPVGSDGSGFITAQFSFKCARVAATRSARSGGGLCGGGAICSGSGGTRRYPVKPPTARLLRPGHVTPAPTESPDVTSRRCFADIIAALDGGGGGVG